VAIADQWPAAQEDSDQTAIVPLPPPTVTIAGEVREPGTVAFWEGMTLSDLITQAGRLNRTANLTLDVHRVIRTAGGERLVIPDIHSIRVDSTYLVNRVAGRIYASYIPGFTYMVDRASAFKLRPCDRVVVGALPRRAALPRRPGE
jgi:protein involved in polysaccharide export with SLBB domain